jgi:D-xylose transport system substrate-binding protein
MYITNQTKRRYKMSKKLWIMIVIGLFLTSSANLVWGKSKKENAVAILLPDKVAVRYEKIDYPSFKEKMAELSPDTKVIYFNADNDPEKQQGQVEQAITLGAKVIVLMAVDAPSAVSMVAKANDAGVKVIIYDRYVDAPGIAVTIAGTPEQVGEVMAQAFIDAVRSEYSPNDGQIVIMNGVQIYQEVIMIKKVLHQKIDGLFKIGLEYDSSDWSSAEAQNRMEQAITKLGLENIIGVYCFNDAMASGVITAMKQAGKIIPNGGIDGELTAVQRVLLGEQYYTVFRSFKESGYKAAEVTVKLMNGEKLTGVKKYTTASGIKADLIEGNKATIVTKSNVSDFVKAGIYTVDEIASTPELRKLYHQYNK